ncbi:MAG: DNA mismatch repair protein MutS [Clostridia bacterium]|nr:DNA mismatch repair protein MutS [Clostridia bacterium]
MAELTPMMQQYMEIKKKCPDAILMFRLGDFYEMFFEDALVASKDLEITLTGRDCGQEERAPMCGVPFHAADSYIARLVAKGHKVAICEQMEDPKSVKGIVKRDIIRIVTPGTIIDDALLNSRKTNYMASVCRIGNDCAVTFADVSTGELLGTTLYDDASCDKLINELARFSPVEIALGGNSYENKKITEYINSRTDALTFVYEYDEVEGEAKELLVSQLKNSSDISEKLLRVSTAALIRYILETQKAKMAHIHTIDIYTSQEFVDLDAATVRNLELVETMRDKAKRGSLFWVLDNTKTSMGARMLKQWILRPLVNAASVNNRLCGVEELVGAISLRDDLDEALTGVNDIERLMSKVSIGTANARDLLSLCQSFSRLPFLSKILNKTSSTILSVQAGNLDTLEDLEDLLERAINPDAPISLREGNIIRDGYLEEIDRLRAITTGGKTVIAELEARERERTGIKTLKVKFNKVFGYFIEVSTSQLSKVPEDYMRKQTLTNGERFITAELKDIESSVLGAGEKLVAIEYEQFQRIRERICEHMERIEKTAHAIAVTDTIYSLAVAAVKNNYTKPEVNLSDSLRICEGRHPVVEKVLSNSLFVPNDTTLDCSDNQICVITGPNMAGKSTYMRQTALIALMAQIGSYVPAQSCSMGIIDKIFTRIGASDDLASGQSTFMLEMNEVSYILKNATKKSLCILDEIGRGTSTFDGLSIAWAVIEHIAKKVGAKTLFATHYHELTALEGGVEGIVNYNTACKKRGDDITFLRRIVRGGTDDSFGIEVAKLAGVPESVIKRAKEVLKTVEGEVRGSETGERIVSRIESENQASMQIGFEDMGKNAVSEALRQIDVTTLTPIEAMNKLYELQKLL